MFSEKDFERLWFLYKTEGEPKGVSINAKNGADCYSKNGDAVTVLTWQS